MADRTKVVEETNPQGWLAEAALRTMSGEQDATTAMIYEQEARGQRRLVTAQALPQEGSVKTRDAMFVWPLHPDVINERHAKQEETKANVIANGGDLSRFIWGDDEYLPPESGAYEDALYKHLMAKDRAERESAALRASVEQGTGIIFGEEVDDLFIQAQLPDGWIIEPTEHSMWSVLKDQNGIERAGIFYKAAFYDRKAHTSWHRRYYVTTWYGPYPGDQDQNEAWRGATEERAIVRDRRMGRVLHVGKTVASESASYDERYGEQRKVEAWLDAHFPDHRDPFAYWD